MTVSAAVSAASVCISAFNTRCADHQDTTALAGSRPLCFQTTLTALKFRPRGAGPVALRDMDALCIRVGARCGPTPSLRLDRLERQPKLMINVRV